MSLYSIRNKSAVAVALRCARYAALLGSMFGARSAFAQATPASAEATEHYNQGHDAMTRGDRDRAYTELKRAWQLQQTGETAGLLGQVERKLCLDRSPTTYCELYVDAARHLTFALNHLPAEHSAEVPLKLKAWFTEIQAQVGTLKIEAPSGIEIRVDGKSEGIAPLTDDVFVTPGPHTVTGSAKGNDVSTEQVNVAKGGTQRVQLTPPAAPQPDAALNHLATPPRADASGVANVNSSDESARPTLVPAYALGGVALVSLGVGILFHSAANRNADEATSLASNIAAGGCATTPVAPNCAALKDKANSHDTDLRASHFGFIAAGVSAGAAIGYLTYALWPRREESKQGLRASVSLTPGNTTVQLSGSF